MVVYFILYLHHVHPLFLLTTTKNTPASNINPGKWINDHPIHAKKNTHAKNPCLPAGGIEGREKGQWSDKEQIHNKNKDMNNWILTLFPRHWSSRRPPSAIPPLPPSVRRRCAEGLKEGKKKEQRSDEEQMRNKNKHIKIWILTEFPPHRSSRRPPSAIPPLLPSLRRRYSLKEGRKSRDQIKSKCVIKISI